MQPDPPPIPTPIPKTDPPSFRKPLRLALLRAAGLALRVSDRALRAGTRTGRNSPSPTEESAPLSRRSFIAPGEGAGGEVRRSFIAPGEGVGGEVAPRILLIRPDHLGDVLFLTPALRLLREQMPGAHLTALVGPWASPVLARNPHLDAIQTLDFPGFTRGAKASPLAPYRYLWQAARALRAQHFDTAVILRFDHWWGALLAALAGIPRRIGYDVPEVRPFLSEALPYEPGRHEVLQNVRLVAHTAGAIAAPDMPAELPLEFQPGPEAVAFVESWLHTKGIASGAPIAPDAVHGRADATRPQGGAPIAPGAVHGRADDLRPPADAPIAPGAVHGRAGDLRPPAGQRYALLVPGSGAAVKLWREDGFARVSEALAARGLKVIVVGAGEAERALARRIAAQSRAPLIDASGETTFEQLAALFARAALAVGTDSGPMHLAVALRTPTIHLFGPVSARTFGPWGEPGRHLVLTSGLACIACNRLDYGPAELAAHPCVPLIADRQVLAAIDALSPLL